MTQTQHEFKFSTSVCALGGLSTVTAWFCIPYTLHNMHAIYPSSVTVAEDNQSMSKLSYMIEGVVITRTACSYVYMYILSIIIILIIIIIVI